MVANVEDILSVDLKYIASLPDPVAPWGMQSPHDSVDGIFVLADEQVRQLPTKTDNITHETIHPSVLKQAQIHPLLAKSLQENPSLLCRLLPLEVEMEKNWPYDPKEGRNQYAS
ncbi:hypothetical protein ID866_2987 [Astraeus odoratus]|nr:hypothetical protein ID866_2987 [Astraeus odoratus]